MTLALSVEEQVGVRVGVVGVMVRNEDLEDDQLVRKENCELR